MAWMLKCLLIDALTSVVILQLLKPQAWTLVFSNTRITGNMNIPLLHVTYIVPNIQNVIDYTNWKTTETLLDVVKPTSRWTLLDWKL